MQPSGVVLVLPACGSRKKNFRPPIKRNTHRSLPAQSDSSPSIHSNSSSSYFYSLSITMSDPIQIAGKRKRSSTSLPHPMIAEPFFSVAQFSGPLDLLLFTHSPYAPSCLACFLFLAVCILSCLLAVFGTPAFSRRYILC